MHDLVPMLSYLSSVNASETETKRKRCTDVLRRDCCTVNRNYSYVYTVAAALIDVETQFVKLKHAGAFEGALLSTVLGSYIAQQSLCAAVLTGPFIGQDCRRMFFWNYVEGRT